MSTTGKTPVSLLSETLIRQGIQPIYNLQQSAVGVSQGMFAYEVSAAGYVIAVGMGRSKKEAKQEAAKNALEKLKNGGISVLEAPEELLVPNVDVISPYAAELKENTVGKLIMICEQHNLPAPVYEPIREDGPPHAKHFEYLCRVSAMTTTAVGRTKKQAKHWAAHNMLMKLNISDTEVVSDPNKSKSDVDLDAVINQYKEAKGENKYPLGMQIGQGFVNDWSTESVEFLQTFQLDPFLMDAQEVLETIVQELQLNFDIFDVPCHENETILVMLVLTTTPKSTFLGSGTTEKQAKNDVCKAAIEYLQVMKG